MSTSDDLYERDATAWAEQQAAALRRHEAGHNQLDYENLAEEIEDVAKSIERACRSELNRILAHLLKLEFVDLPENRRGWRLSVRSARNELEDEITPTLRNRLPALLPKLLKRQVELVTEQYDLPPTGPIRTRLDEGYSWAEVTDPDWFPAPACGDV